MRTILAAAALAAAVPAVPPAALAGQATASLGVSVTVLAACPPGSGRPCAPPAAASGSAGTGTPATASPAPPIAVLRDEVTGMVTIVY
ncbi:hypothetical protein [Geminicoccus flavidas]|uniref:hypothetical protein n=1 Tax=Geminicoccus flavidas TaxID=2506407 RepID=UPI00135C97A7|nr:hypothetical protein [Geminicoccus flavidas]